MDQDRPRSSRPYYSSVNRRIFFRRILGDGVEALERLSDRVLEGFRSAAPRARPFRYLRPPGALPELALAATCSQCSKCVDACPADCIRIASGGGSRNIAVAGGLPYIVARDSPCVVCDDLSCMKACPTGALTVLPGRDSIDMGRAEVDHRMCLRTIAAPGVTGPARGGPEVGGEDCRVCIEQCPFGRAAIELDGQGRVEVRDGCVGCGICEWACPTEPASITVRPQGVESAQGSGSDGPAVPSPEDSLG